MSACSNAGVEAGKVGRGECAFDLNVELSEKIPTVGIVEWSVALDTVDEARVEFGLDASYGMTAPVDLDEPGYRTLLLGMKPSRTYHFRIVAIGGERTCETENHTLTTGPLENGLPVVTRTRHRDGPSRAGFIVSSFLGDGPAFILDSDGEYVWWYGKGAMGRASLSYDGRHLWYAGVNVVGGEASMRRVTMDGLVEDDFISEFGEIHHDFTVLPDETIAFLQHGAGEDSELDRVVERTPDGALRRVITVADVHGRTQKDHANSIQYFAADDTYSISDLNQNAYFKVTRDGEVVWVLGGEASDFTGDGAAWERQHGHHVLGPERLLFLNNGPLATGTAAAIEVLLDLETMTATRTWEYQTGTRTSIYGDAQRLPSGTTLITLSAAGIMEEVSPSGEVLETLKWPIGGSIGYATARASLYGTPPE